MNRAEQTVVLVPHDEGVSALSRVPDVQPVRYDPKAPLPASGLGARVLIPAFLAPAAALEVVAQLPDLMLVQLLSAGAEHWLGALPDGIALSDCKGAHGGATAEWVLAVLLATYRQLPRFVRAQDEGRWDHSPTEELAGKRVLILGAGDLGTQTARRLASFDATATLVASTARPGVHGIDEVPVLLPEHDVCVLTVPLTPATAGLVDKDFLAAMPDGAVLVNAARGKIVDTEALVNELTSGRLRAALDVTDPEPLPEGHPLWQAPGLLLTPHVGGGVPEAMRRAYAVVAEQLAAFVRGEDPPNLVRGDY